MNHTISKGMKKILTTSFVLVIFLAGFSVVMAQSSGAGAGYDPFGGGSGAVSGGDEGNATVSGGDGGNATVSGGDGGNATVSGGDGGSGRVSGTGTGFDNPLKFKSFLGFFKAVVRGVIVPVGVVIAVLALIYSGFLFVVAQGNEEKIRKARVTFFYTVVGTILLLGAWAIVEAITGTVCQIANIPGLCP